ncbi:MAG: PNGase F N-terminal domain-containing protein [Bacteroidota bacterium]
MKNSLKISILAILLCSACKEKELRSIGDRTVTVFKNENVYFDMAFKEDPELIINGMLRLDAGRVVLNKVRLPNYELQPKVTIDVTLTSNGDPWDKSGSLFIIPKTADLTTIDFEDGKFDLKALNQKFPAVSSFQKDSLLHQPNVEILRFMTPFGVGHFNDHERVKDRKPVYIPKWENEVRWSQDITHLLPLLEGEVYIGVFIDTWTKEGYNITATLNFKESDAPNHAKKQQTVLPLLNTIKYASDQRLYDEFARSDLEISFDLPKTADNAKLYYTTTGHGGHSGGDEFVKKRNQISIDGETIRSFIPWRDDCASFRRFNPTSAVWKANEFYDDVDDCEKIASSDLSRSNWCPGSDVAPDVMPLSSWLRAKTTHTLNIAIPEAQEAKQNENNYWMVSAYIVYDNE